LSYNFDKGIYEKKKVINTNIRPKGKAYELKFRNGTSIKASPKHKWFVKHKVTDKLEVVTTEDLDLNTYYLPVALNIPTEGLKPVTNEEAYLLGMYIAEGHRRPTERAFFISQLKKDSCKVIENKLNKTDWVWQKNQKGFYISESNILSLVDKCGKSSYTKTIPEECFSWSKELLRELYNGLIDGDGTIQEASIDSRGYNRSKMEDYYTVSEQLNKDIRYLMLLLNKPSHLSSRVHSGFGSKKLQYAPRWVEGSQMNNGKLTIKSIEVTDDIETYDITVEDNESFILPQIGIITHNCPEGYYLIQQMEERGWNVKPMSFKKDKVAKYMAFRSFRVKSYKDLVLEQEMKSIQEEETIRTTKIRKPSGGTDDMIDSFVMSCYFYLEPKQNDFKFYDLGDEE